MLRFLAAACVFALVHAASAQVLTVTVTDAHDGSSVCWVAPHTLFCVCPGLTSDFYGEPAPEVIHAPYASPSCTPDWSPGIWNTEFGVTSEGDIGVTQAVTNDVPFNDIGSRVPVRSHHTSNLADRLIPPAACPIVRPRLRGGAVR